MHHLLQICHMMIFSVDLSSIARNVSPFEICFIAFFVIFLESASFFFLFLPGDSLLFILGVLTQQNIIHGPIIFMITLLAATIGNICNYCMGQWIGNRLLSSRFRFLSEQNIDRSRHFFDRYGPISIVIARFVPLFRSVIPFLSGMVSMNYIAFLVASLIGGMAWTGIAIGAGYLLGDITLIKDHIALLVVLALIFSFISLAVIILKQYKSHR